MAAILSQPQCVDTWNRATFHHVSSAILNDVMQSNYMNPGYFTLAAIDLNP